MKSARLNAWLRPDPEAPPDRQVLVGDGFEVFERKDGWARGRATKDGYEGWLPEAALSEAIHPSHWISVRSTWGFAAPDIKSLPMIDLHMTSPVEVVSEAVGWCEVRIGERGIFVPSAHCRRIGERAIDAVGVARAFLGTPYVWAGNTGFGLDCSGLVQAALRATGVDCPADSGDQETMAGTAVTHGELAPGDLIFWKGHVAMVSGENAIIHANAHHMAVVEEPMDEAFARIAASETGDVTSMLRVIPQRG